MVWTVSLRSLAALAWGLALSGCALSTPIGEQHPSVQRAPPSADDSDEARQATARLTAATDLGCARVELVLTFERRYANGASPRYVFEGCGKRALYAETCQDYPRCRYLMLSLVALPSEPPGPRGDAP